MLPQSPRGRLALVALSVATVALAPLATTDGASAVEISGARTLSDTVHVDFTDRQPATTSDVHLLGFNDFHGNLEPAGLNIYGRFAGGAAYLAKAVQDRQAQYERDVTVFAGDHIGASPLANALFDEEPAVIVANHMNVDVASVGNHEFDKGAAELVRIQRGGCPAEGCSGAPYARPDRKPTDVYPGGTSPTCPPTLCRRTASHYSSRPSPRPSGGTPAASSRSASSARRCRPPRPSSPQPGSPD